MQATDREEVQVRWRYFSGKPQSRRFADVNSANEFVDRLRLNNDIVELTVGRRPVMNWRVEQILPKGPANAHSR